MQTKARWIDENFADETSESHDRLSLTLYVSRKVESKIRRILVNKSELPVTFHYKE